MSDVLELVIAVVFVWFLLSLAVSAVNEAFSWITRLRAKQLWRSLAGIVDATVKPEARLRDIFFRVPFGLSDYRPKVVDGDETAFSKGREAAQQRVDARPSGPRPEDPFVNRLYDRLRKSIPETAGTNWRTRVSNVPPRLLGDALLSMAEETISRGSLLEAATALGYADIVAWIEANAPASGPVDEAWCTANVPPGGQDRWEAVVADAKRLLSFDDIEAIVSANPQLSGALRRVRETVTGNPSVVHARAAIEGWFDAEMDAVTRFYRRQNRKVAAVIAFALVFVVQADSIRLVGDLWRDRDLRAVLASGGDQAVAGNLPAGDPAAILEVCRAIGQGNAAPVATTVAPPTTAVGDSPSAEEVAREAKARLDCAVELVSGTRRFTIVEPSAIWTEIADEGTKGRFDISDLWWWGWHRVPGRLVTLLALLFGAQFWYDVLRRLVGIKATVAKAVVSGGG